ncbi:hypothetical protein L1987_49000 [Smallanthus sonchifolius]|uniref:Uncharacterized protein n=1 Tax=Smallanthus sonchifolius TaxID=185202 RepID=A0ACB9FSV2_9ASTR|nr:hypothetical protein L1987_49000 [Smallanthus sonchifolius]
MKANDSGPLDLCQNNSMLILRFLASFSKDLWLYGFTDSQTLVLPILRRWCSYSLLTVWELKMMKAMAIVGPLRCCIVPISWGYANTFHVLNVSYEGPVRAHPDKELASFLHS